MDSILQRVVDLVHWAANEKGEQMPRAQEKSELIRCINNHLSSGLVA
jgi:hypothetical protein